MNTRISTVRWFAMIVSLTVLVLPRAAFAQLLDEVETESRRDGGADIRFNFSVPVQLLRVVPESSGKTVYISLRLVGADSGLRPSTERAGTFNNLGGRLGLVDATLELSGPEGDRLIVRFNRATPYTVTQGRDGRSIVVTVPSQGLNVPPAIQLTDEMTRARQSLVEGKNEQAIVLFQKIIKAPENPDTQVAHELLGLAYERNRQTSKAIAQYRRYLRLYPDGPGADRVQQRLRNLTRSSGQPLLKPGARRQGQGETLVYGAVSQRYFAGSSSSVTGSGIDQSLFISDIALTGRKRTEGADYKAVFNADHKYDLLNSVSESRVQNAYIEAKSNWHGLSGKLGRQRGRGAGVLDRFDGALVGGEVLPKWRLNAVAGVPVDLWANNSQREFSGLSLDAGTFAGKWSATVFGIDSKIDGLKDRQAVGTELRYFSKQASAFGMVDYDTYFNDLNVAMVQANWRTRDDWNTNVLVDVRKAPYLHLGNALLAPVNGASYDSMTALVTAEPLLDIQQLARDRTTSSRTVSAGITLPSLGSLGVKGKYLPKFRLGGDVSYTATSDLPASAGQPAIPGHEMVTLSARGIATNLFRKNEITVAGLSMITNTDYQAISAYLTERNQVRQHWRFDAGLKLYYQDNNVGTSLVRITPSVRVEYRKNRAVFEFELGHETSQSVNPLQTENIDRDFIAIGYRYDF